MGKKQNKIGVVYSTNPDFEYMYEEEELVETLPASMQTLKIQLDKKQRAGKQVTLINNFIGTQEDLKERCKELKAKCGVGGSCSEGEILLHGDHRDKVAAYLQDKGYKVKRLGGLFFEGVICCFILFCSNRKEWSEKSFSGSQISQNRM